MVFIDKHIVYPAGEPVVESGKDLDFGGIGDIQDNQSVLAVGSALAGNHSDAPVFGYLHIVNRAGIHMYRVNNLHVGWIGDVPEVGVSVGAPGAGSGVVASVNAFPDPQVGGAHIQYFTVTHYFKLTLNISGGDLNSGLGNIACILGQDGIGPGLIGDKPPVFLDKGGSAAPAGVNLVGGKGVCDRRVGYGIAFTVFGNSRKVDHITGTGLLLVGR